MDSLVLEANPRASTQKANGVRTAGRIPAVYYGRGQKSFSLDLPYQAFRKLFAKAGENTIIELKVDGKTIPVLVHDIQFHPVTDVIIHVDFIHVDMKKEVTTVVKVNVIGLAPAVKNLGGILDIHKHEVKIKCLPKDLIHSIDVDVSSIVDFHTSIHVSDLKVPATIKILDNPSDTVATVVPVKIEEEVKPATETAALPEGATAPAEGAAAVPGTPAASAPAGKEAKGKEAKK